MYILYLLSSINFVLSSHINISNKILIEDFRIENESTNGYLGRQVLELLQNAVDEMHDYEGNRQVKITFSENSKNAEEFYLKNYSVFKEFLEEIKEYIKDKNEYYKEYFNNKKKPEAEGKNLSCSV